MVIIRTYTQLYSQRWKHGAIFKSNINIILAHPTDKQTNITNFY